MLSNLQEYKKPRTTGMAIKILHQYGDSASFIAGGIDIAIENNPSIKYLIDITDLPLKYIKENSRSIKIGALVTLQELTKSDVLKNLVNGIICETASQCATRQVRNVATIGGDIVCADLSSDMPAPLIALDAQIKLIGVKERIVPLSEFYISTRKTIIDKELLTEIIIPKPAPNTKGATMKMGLTEYDVSLVNVSVVLLIEDEICKKARIALTGVTPIPTRVRLAEEVMEGKKITDELIEKASSTVGELITPVSDFRASDDYKRQMAVVLTKRAIYKIIGQ